MPVATVAGSLTVTYDPTVDLTDGTPDSLSLTIGDHTYTLGEVGVTIHSSGYFVGALAGGGIDTVTGGIDDFEFQLNPDGSFHHFMYSVAGIYEIFASSIGDSSVTTRTVSQDVPEPATAALFGGGLLAVGWLRRRRAQARR